MKKFYNGLPFYGKIIFWVLIAITIYVLYRKLLVYLQALKVHELAGTQVTVNGTQLDLGAKALTIYDSFYNYWGGMAEDETTAINALKSVPNNYVPTLSQLYFNLYSKDLKQDFTKYTDFDKVSNKCV